MSGLTVTALGEISVQDNFQFIEADVRDFPCLIYLPSIKSRESFVDRKFYVNDYYENAGTNNITLIAPEGCRINGQQQITLGQNGVSALITISGIKDYLASLSINDSSSSSQIDIPTPLIKLGKVNNTYKSQDLYAYYLPKSNNSFLNYNPKYYLFMAKSSGWHKKINNGITSRFRKIAGFYHPTHQNGINFPTNSAFYSGSTAIPLDTEFNLTQEPYTKTQIPFNPFQWIRVDNGGGSWTQVVISDLNGSKNVDTFKFQGKRSKRNNRSVLFCLAIGIENPDNSSQFPILFSELSQPFKMTFSIINANKVNGINLTIQNSNIHRKII